jgi:hypothetical protein
MSQGPKSVSQNSSRWARVTCVTLILIQADDKQEAERSRHSAN